ncbi:NAD(P)H-binding protein [Chryseobacterium gregarium]|uniref:NAD(P)H-binding protein n=1 Tax=Chryseobacterium gregarium TaxID=456299 RepID=UPI000411EE1E|nr:NAD(P)H-binding protein [Chryseobacterium gregarium]
MNIVLTGSLGNIGKPLAAELLQKGHHVKVISSTPERRADIEALGAEAAIGTMQDGVFLTEAFRGADIVYLMEAWEGIGSIFDNSVDFVAGFENIGHNYKLAVEESGVKKIIHLSSIGAHTDHGTGSLYLHHKVEKILGQLPDNVSIKFMRPVGFYTNIFRYAQTIKKQGAIIQGYGGDQKEPWVSPVDIAAAIAGETEQPFEGRTVRYLASDEVSPNEIAAMIGEAIGNPDLMWKGVSDEEMLSGMLAAGMNEWIAKGFVEMQAAQRNGSLYEDYYRNRPVLGKTKMKDFAKEFALIYHSLN